MPSKKRSSHNRKAHRQGLSGNPQRRAQQLGQDRRSGRDLSVFRRPQADPDRAAFRELAYRLAGGARPESWWRESHERILARARALIWPARLVDVETQACQIVGDEFYDRLRSPGTGLHPAQWLRALAEETGAALRATLAQGADGWQKLWALLCGLALTAPRTPAGAVDETVRERFPEFPGIKDPLETALAEAKKFATLAADRGLEPGLGHLAGVFASAEDALGEWREAVGPAATGAELSSCPAGTTAQLLAPCLRAGPLADMLQGNEPRDLIREHYRLRRRARDLTGSADAAAGSSPFDAGHAPDAFLNWYATRHNEVPGAVTQATATIYEEWGLHEYPDERSFHACSPHRIEMTAHLIRESYVADYANPSLRLLPEWTQWCIERTGLDGDAAARSRQAARSASSAPGHDQDDEPAAEHGKAPFRRQE